MVDGNRTYFIFKWDTSYALRIKVEQILFINRILFIYIILELNSEKFHLNSIDFML